MMSKNSCPNFENESSVIPGTARNSAEFFGNAFDNAKSTLSLRTALGGIELSLEIYMISQVKLYIISEINKCSVACHLCIAAGCF